MNNEIASIENGRTHASENYSAKIAKLSKLWVPFSKTLVLHGLRMGEEIFRDSAAVQEKLGEHWAATFAAKFLDEAAAAQLLTTISIPDYDGDASPPTSEDIQDHLRRCRDSAPGPDGIRYWGWQIAGELGAETLHSISEELQTPGAQREYFNVSTLICPPKGEHPDDAAECIRLASETRPST